MTQRNPTFEATNCTYCTKRIQAGQGYARDYSYDADGNAHPIARCVECQDRVEQMAARDARLARLAEVVAK